MGASGAAFCATSPRGQTAPSVRSRPGSRRGRALWLVCTVPASRLVRTRIQRRMPDAKDALVRGGRGMAARSVPLRSVPQRAAVPFRACRRLLSGLASGLSRVVPAGAASASWPAVPRLRRHALRRRGAGRQPRDGRRGPGAADLRPTFDLVVTQDVLEHVLDPARAAEIARTLRPGGAHVFTVPWYHQPTLRRAHRENGVVVHDCRPSSGNHRSARQPVITEWQRPLDSSRKPPACRRPWSDPRPRPGHPRRVPQARQPQTGGALLLRRLRRRPRGGRTSATRCPPSDERPRSGDDAAAEAFSVATATSAPSGPPPGGLKSRRPLPAPSRPDVRHRRVAIP